MNEEVLKKMLTSITVEKQNYESYNKILRNENEKLKDEIQKLYYEIHKLKNENEQLKNIPKIHKLKNERGAGRKKKFEVHDIESIKMYRLQGKTIKQIAEIYHCSVGLIHKLINEKE